MAIDIVVADFTGPWAGRNNTGTALAINAADVVRAAVTVGGPVGGTPWHRCLRRGGVAGSSLSALAGAGRVQPLATTSLYRQLESTEKSGVSFRLGMAFAALAAEHMLKVPLLEHLNRGNSVLQPGSQRRADLFGLGPRDEWHVIEAKSRTYGFGRREIDYAKQQSLNVVTVRPNGSSLIPATRSACLADLSKTPIAVLLVDPATVPDKPVQYEVDTERLIGSHYSAVPDLIAAQGGPQSPPDELSGADVIGAFLPGTDIWLGLAKALVGGSTRSWERRVRERYDGTGDQTPGDNERLSYGADGYVLHLGNDLARTYEWLDDPNVEGEQPAA